TYLEQYFVALFFNRHQLDQPEERRRYFLLPTTYEVRFQVYRSQENVEPYSAQVFRGTRTEFLYLFENCNTCSFYQKTSGLIQTVLKIDRPAEYQPNLDTLVISIPIGR